MEGSSKRKRTHGHGQQCSDRGVGVEVGEGIRGINGNEKNTNK